MGGKRILLHSISVIPILLEISAGVNSGIHVALGTFGRQVVLKKHLALIDLSLLVLGLGLRPTALSSDLPRHLHLIAIAFL